MITIISATTYNRPDFILLQYESIKKNIIGEFEYIVINNAKFSSIDSSKDSMTCYNEIHEVCNKLNIKCIDVEDCSNIKQLCQTHSNYTILNGKYTNDSYACLYAIQYTITKIALKLNNPVCLVDADLFFIDKINLEEILLTNDTFYIPQYRKSGELVEYMWNMFCGFNFKKQPKLEQLNFKNGIVDGALTDVGGHTHYFLKNNKDVTRQYIEEFSLYDISTVDKNIKVHLVINGNNNFNLLFDAEYNLLEYKNTENTSFVNDTTKKVLPYELEKDNYVEYIAYTVKTLLFKLINSNSELNMLPNPLRLGFVKRREDNYFFALHYRSSANYLDYATRDYNIAKTKLLKQLL